ncbi:MAG: hypothetical protein EOR60_01840 [Mesorhizobium sp.]|nr:MAG: hypothetical protein EOR60_01840 [Mesorhizobium sp.]
MTGQRNREEAVNTQLAILISKLGVTADAETIHVHGKHRPDVLFQMGGLRVVIEGKFDDHPSAEKVVLNDARKRVASGVAHIACAVIYSKPLRSAQTTKILDVLGKSNLRYRIVSETHETDWFEGSPTEIMGALRRAQAALAKDDIVEQTARALATRLEGVTQLWMGQAGPCDRLSSILGIRPPKGEAKDKAEARRESAAKVSALVLANALIFQEQLAATDGRISSLRKIEKSSDLVDAIAAHWKWIWENINYVPIFQLGERVLAELPTSKNTTSAVDSLLKEAKAICEQQAALRHDLMGRIYHWLLHNAKYLGTYYTSVSSATLLLKLAMAADWKQDFGDPVALASFKVADLACGTGTLLMAAAQAVSDVYIRVRAEDGRSLDDKDLSTLHRAIMENMLHGYDVLPSAVHLTASTLAMLAPEVAFVKMNLFVMPLGVDHGQARLGSLDFLEDNEIKTQMALDYSHAETVQTGAAFTKAAKAKVPPLDLCVMNPPFVRSVGGNLLFGSLPDQRGAMQKELKARVKNIGASATAGLGSVFVALADRRLAKGGRLAFVLPAALASGEAWGPTRRLIAERYHLETVVSSHDAERPNFSENTELSELLFIAKKRGKEPASATTYVNLWRNPRSIHEALDLATRIIHSEKPVDITGVGFTSIPSSNGKLGEVVTTPPPVGEGIWAGAFFAQTELSRACWGLQTGDLLVPGDTKKHSIPICRLDALGDIGPDRKRIHEGFKVSTEDWSPYAGFWGHESSKVRTMAQKPNCKLVVWTESPRGPNYGPHLFERAGRILLVERLRSNTHRVTAVRLNKDVLGNTWWALRAPTLTVKQEKALMLWLNSSVSVLLFYGRRVITQGAWMQMKQPAWESMPVLDVRALKTSQIDALADIYDSLAEEELQPISQLDQDEVRIRIDSALTAVLKLPDVDPIRELLSREPGLNAKDINPRLDDEEDEE